MAKEMGSDLEAMYRAGKQDIPEEAAHVSKISGDLYDVIDTFNVQSALAGDPKIMVDMLTVAGDLYDVLRAAVTSLNNCSAAVIATADDFRKTDQNAARDYANMGNWLKELTPTPATPPPEVKNPEAPGASTTIDSPSGPHSVDIGSTGDPTRTPEQDRAAHEEAERQKEYEWQRKQRGGR